MECLWQHEKNLLLFSPETQSDQSDFEGKIRALNEELRRRKAEADKLKRERKKKRKELMKNKEESLKKQIEVKICTTTLFIGFILSDVTILWFF